MDRWMKSCFPIFYRTTARRKVEAGLLPHSDDAWKKFGDAKAISSDMFFGKQDSSEVMSTQMG